MVIVPIEPDELVVKSTGTGEMLQRSCGRSKVKTLVERTKAICKQLGRGTTEKPDHLQYYLLRAPGNRPRRRRTAQQRDELAPFQSRPIAFAVLMLITSSYLVGACTGRSAGLSPRVCDRHRRPRAAMAAASTLGHQAAVDDVRFVGSRPRQLARQAK